MYVIVIFSALWVVTAWAFSTVLLSNYPIANNKPKEMASEDLFMSNTDDSDDSTPDIIEVDGWAYTPTTIPSVSKDKWVFDSITRLVVEKFGLIGITNDMDEAEYYFGKYCRNYVRTSEKRMHELSRYVRLKSSNAQHLPNSCSSPLQQASSPPDEPIVASPSATSPTTSAMLLSVSTLSEDIKVCPVCHIDIYATSAGVHDTLNEHMRSNHFASPPSPSANDTLDDVDVDLEDLAAASVLSATARAAAAESAVWKPSRHSGTKHLPYQDCYSDQDFFSSSDEMEESKERK